MCTLFNMVVEVYISLFGRPSKSILSGLCAGVALGFDFYPLLRGFSIHGKGSPPTTLRCDPTLNTHNGSRKCASNTQTCLDTFRTMGVPVNPQT